MAPHSLPAIDEAAIATAVRVLRAGHLVAFPTETVYGLGANALDAEAVARIYAVKGRPATSPLIVHVASVEMAQSLVATWPDTAGRLAHKFWPGPLTLVLEKSMERRTPSPVRAERSSAAIPSIVTAGLPTVGLRIPSHPVALALLRAAGIPLAAPSANRFTQLSPTTADHVRASLGHDVDYILDGGPCHVGIESTVLSLAGPNPVLLRPGAISRQLLESEIGPIITAAQAPTGAHPSPGMHARHYSPRTSLLLVTNGEVPEHGKGVYLQHMHLPTRTDVAVIEMPLAAADYASALYDTLHRADHTERDWIAVDQPPETPNWEAIHDRLRRAASK
jgi:L-threonylcarbamoyladenylate synthase